MTSGRNRYLVEAFPQALLFPTGGGFVQRFKEKRSYWLVGIPSDSAFVTQHRFFIVLCFFPFGENAFKYIMCIVWLNFCFQWKLTSEETFQDEKVSTW